MVDINKKKLFQVSLVIIGFAILFFTYFFNFEKSRSLKETKKEEIPKLSYLRLSKNRKNSYGTKCIKQIRF